MRSVLLTAQRPITGSQELVAGIGVTRGLALRQMQKVASPKRRPGVPLAAQGFYGERKEAPGAKGGKVMC